MVKMHVTELLYWRQSIEWSSIILFIILAAKYRVECHNIIHNYVNFLTGYIIAVMLLDNACLID